MPFLNVEIKAKCSHPAVIRQYLLGNNADFIGSDVQTDTYFNVGNGRLKLREGNIENNLIYYSRENQAGPKSSHFSLLKTDNPELLKEILTKANGVKVVVKKIREIYYILNVKFHIDEVPGLGSFVEIEAGNKEVNLTQEELLRQCEFYIREFGINKEDMVDVSYSDMLLEKPI